MTKRFYSGARTGSRTMGEAAKLKRIELEKGGKLAMSSTDRYKRIMKKKLEAAQAESMGSRSSTFNLPGAAPVERKMSKTTEQAMRMISQRKAMKEEKELRKMVVVKPQLFSDAGRIDAKGNAYDLGNNLTLKVDLKNGVIKTQSGWTVGKYNNKRKYKTNALIQDALKKHGAYFLQQKKIMMLQEQERLAKLYDDGTTVWGSSASERFLEEHYGAGAGGGVYGAAIDNKVNRGSGVNAWGAMSNSVMGTHAENIWGGMADNVWGGTDSNIWGGLGGSAWGDGGGWGGGSGGIWGKRMGVGGIFGGSANWGKRGLKVWGSGKHGQKNHLRKLAAIFAGVPVIGKLVARQRMRSR